MAKEKKRFNLFKKNKEKEQKQDAVADAIKTEESLEDTSSVDVQQDVENIQATGNLENDTTSNASEDSPVSTDSENTTLAENLDNDTADNSNSDIPTQTINNTENDLNDGSNEDIPISTDSETTDILTESSSEDSPISTDEENLEDSQNSTKEKPEDLVDDAKDLDISENQETVEEITSKEEIAVEKETPQEVIDEKQETSTEVAQANSEVPEEIETTKASDEEKNKDEVTSDESKNDEITMDADNEANDGTKEDETTTEADEETSDESKEDEATTEAINETSDEIEDSETTVEIDEETSDEIEEPIEELDPETIEQQEKEEAERILKEQEEERLAKEKEAEEQRKRNEAWEKEKARLALERKLKSEKILQDAIDCADTLTKLIEEEAPSEVLIEEIQKAEGLLEKLQMEIDSPWVEEFKPKTEHEKLEEAAAEVLIAKAKVIIEEIEKLRADMQSAVPDDLEEDYYLSDEEQDAEIGFKIHKPADDLEGQEVSEEDLTEAEIEKAYDVGVGQELDDYDREILDPVFENYLRMSPNSLKYRYSKLKNEIMSYSQMTHSFDGLFENFRSGRNVILRFSVSNDKLFLYCALPLGSLDKKVYPHKKAVGAHGKITPTVIEIKDEKGVANAIEIISVVMAKNNIMHKKHFVPLAYAERYPLNPNAVILGYEHIPPIEGQYDDEFEYDPITGEIVDGIVKAKVRRTEDPTKLTGKAKLEDMRQVAKTIKASVAMTEPIVYFYDAAIDASNNVQYINIQQVLNDKFFGKIVPQAYFAVAEGSDRIETLNFLALEHAVKLANANKGMRYVLAISVRLLLREKVFERLLRNAKTENHNLVLALDCSLLESIGDIGLNAVTKLRNECSAMIMIDNAENAGMRVLTEYDYEYLRFDARYYAGESPRQQAHLQMLAQYCKTQNIRSTSINVLSTKEAQTLIKLGVEIIQGYAVSEPKRNLNQAVRNIKKIPPTR